MALDEKQRLALDCFFPGLIQKLEALGPGEFQPKRPAFKPRGNGIGYADIRVTYVLADRMYLELIVQLKLKADRPPLLPGHAANLADWDRSYYALGYQQHLGDRVFAADFNQSETPPRHVHMRPNIKEHVPVEETKPSTFDMDPRVFVDLIAEFRRDSNRYPVKRIARKQKKQ